MPSRPLLSTARASAKTQEWRGVNDAGGLGCVHHHARPLKSNSNQNRQRPRLHEALQVASPPYVCPNTPSIQHKARRRDTAARPLGKHHHHHHLSPCPLIILAALSPGHQAAKRGCFAFAGGERGLSTNALIRSFHDAKPAGRPGRLLAEGDVAKPRAICCPMQVSVARLPCIVRLAGAGS